MPQNGPKIAGAGICCLDHIVVAPSIPWGDTAAISGYSVQGGGLVATAIVACARLGARCDLFSLLGDDPTGDQIIAELNSEGVDTRGVARPRGGASPFSFVHVDEESGERTIFHRSGQGLSEAARHIDMSGVVGAQALLVDDVYLDLACEAARIAREHNIPVIADLVPGGANADLLRHVDVLIAPRHFARRMGCERDLDKALDAIHALGPPTAIITLGADGWVYSDNRGRGRGQAFEVGVVDTTGAGDAFHGAYAYATALGWATGRCCEFAAAVAAITCTAAGGRAGLPYLSQVARFLKQRSSADWTDISPGESDGAGGVVK